MNVREISQTLNSKGFIGIAELKENYVFLQPAGIEVSKIWVVRQKQMKARTSRHTTGKPMTNRRSALLKYENRQNTTNRVLSRVSKSLNLAPTFKLYTKNSLLEYTKTLNATDIRAKVDANFESDFYHSFRNHTRIRFISNTRMEILLEPELVFKFFTFKSPYSSKNFSILFHPSSYLNSEGDIWKVISILGEDFFEKQLLSNHLIINAQFIENSFKESSQKYFISETNKKIFAALNERVKVRNVDVQEIELSKLLSILDINAIEELIEKGEIKY